MSVKLTYEHPPGSDQSGAIREFEDFYQLETNRGKLRADEVQVGDYVRTTPKYMTKIVNVELVGE